MGFGASLNLYRPGPTPQVTGKDLAAFLADFAELELLDDSPGLHVQLIHGEAIDVDYEEPLSSRLKRKITGIATAVENADAARSSLMDLDVAREMANFTSKQILVQAGIAMLSQANQLPQNLLRLLQ